MSKTQICKKPHILAWSIWNMLSHVPVSRPVYLVFVILEKAQLLYFALSILANVL